MTVAAVAPPPAAPSTPPGDDHPARWRALLLLALAELLGMSFWSAASAVGPQCQAMWGLRPLQTAWLTTVVQFGFVAGSGRRPGFWSVRRLLAGARCPG